MICLNNMTNIENVMFFGVAWYLLNKFFNFIYFYQQYQWNSNLVNFTHAIIISTILGTEYMTNTNSNGRNYYFDLSIAFFAYDLINVPIGSLYFYHHIVSIIGITTIRSSELIDVGKLFLLTFEIGNLPIYIVYIIMKSGNTYWRNHRFIKHIMIMELIWYAFFRCFIPIKIVLSINYLPYKMFGMAFVFASVLWLKGLVKQIINVNNKS